LFTFSIEDTGGSTTNPFILAKRQMESNDPITAKTINDILAPKGILITDKELEVFSQLPFVNFNLPPTDEDKKKLFTVIGSSDSKTKSFQVVYIFTDKTTNKKYV
jgi:hypothetical protein